MQIWIFFEDGAGGDSFANLLESASNVDAIDNDKQWRIHRYVDYQPKFWMPCPDQNHCFTNLNKVLPEQQYKFYNSTNVLSKNYTDLVTNKKNIVITSRDLKLNFLSSPDCVDILTQDQVKILLKKQNSSTIYQSAITKNLLELRANVDYRPTIVDESTFDLTVFFEDILDWSFTKQLTNQLNLNISAENFLHWKKIVQQELFYVTPGIEYYQSYINEQGYYQYTKIDNPVVDPTKSVTH